ncbi:DUF6199 family natural product biosynthesis protein [Actinomyces sp. ZJ308]|uniref:DUF6199 family natural product biosynthesis protein n=1 Tax=Actinomyces sp. ZJ308 TaxID=2708342 RepID=UPI001FBA7FFC|nr:DUF6199 family natural product biosynthesis protein [Actinomyces sp. ZJ308]
MRGLQALLIIAAIIWGLLGLWQMVNPKGSWRATEGWKYKNPEANEPSEASYGLRSLGGFFSIIMAAVLVGYAAQVGKLDSSDSRSTNPAALPLSSYYGGYDDGLADYTVPGRTVDPFSSASASPVANGAPVTLFTPVVEGLSEHGRSDSSTEVAVKPIYYPWTSSDQPAAFASATVVDSKVALATLDPSQATTEGAGAGVLGEGVYIVVQLGRAVCAITSVNASLSDRQNSISLSVYGISDLSRCGQPVEGAFVAIPLSEELIQAAQAYQSPDYHPLATPTSTELNPPYRRSYGLNKGEYSPTIFHASRRTEFEDTWNDPATDAEIDRRALVPWIAPGS